MSESPPVVRYCVSCKHPAHGGRVCGVATFFTGACRCDMRPPDFDERKAAREHDEDWYPDDRD